MPTLMVKQVKSWPFPITYKSADGTNQAGMALHVAIQFDGHGYLLIVREIGGSYESDCWHPSLAKAEEAAQGQFGIGTHDWEWVAVA